MTSRQKKLSIKNNFSINTETLRKNPPAGVSSKVCTNATELTDYQGNIVPIEKGTVVQIPIYCFHYDDRFYADPETFDPDRFSAANGGLKSYKEKGVFLSFLDGPRQCLGMTIKSFLVQHKTNFDEIICVSRNEICVGTIKGSRS